jgi:hypothetical protein
LLALYILLGLLAFVLLLVLLVLFVPVYGRVTYDGELRVRVRVLGVSIALLPSEDEPEEKKPTSEKKKPAKPSKTKELLGEVSRSFKEDGVAATLHYLGELAKLAGQAVGRVLHSITVDKLQLELIVADGDADTTAIRYGQVCGVLYPAFTAIAGVIKVRKRDLRVEPNFLLENTTVRADVRLHIRVYRVVGAAIVLLVKFMLLKQQEPNDLITDKEETNHGK